MWLKGTPGRYRGQGESIAATKAPSWIGVRRDQAEKYVEYKIQMNGIENCWSLLKRMLKGTYVGVELFHLFTYLDEESFRFNTRDDDGSRVSKIVAAVTGRRLTYNELLGS